MKILIFEDETEAAKNLSRMIEEIEPNAIILDKIETVSEGIEWFKNNPQPDLIISDIQLADGNSFEIFEEIKITCPVIFTTAFDEFAIKSFTVHSIDYILKPIDKNALQKAFEKYKALNNKALPDYQLKLEEFFRDKNLMPKPYRGSFLIRYRDKILPIKTEDFAYFFTKEGMVYGKTKDDKSHIIENTLEELENQLNPSQFFRANRQFIISKSFVNEIEFYFNGRLLVKTIPVAYENILISKERVPVFKKWFELS
jgi:two-component system, LytTR family, response regulator LytT